MRLHLRSRRCEQPTLIVDGLHGCPAELLAQERAVLLKSRTIVVAREQGCVALGRLLAELLQHRLRSTEEVASGELLGPGARERNARLEILHDVRDIRAPGSCRHVWRS